MFSLIGKIIALGTASLIGLVEGAIFFSDGGSGDTMTVRLLLAATLALGGGLVVGYNFRRLWWLALINVWSPIGLIAAGVSRSRLDATAINELAVMVAPIGFALAGGLVGSKLKALKKMIMSILIAGGGFIAVGFYAGLWGR